MAKPKKAFDPRSPQTWTWAGLNAWVTRQRRVEALQAALDAEQLGGGRQIYELRIQSRINHLRGRAALAEIKKGHA